MSINQVAIIVHEDEQVIRELAQKMHIWVAATDKNKVVVEALWQLDTPEELTISHYVVSPDSSEEEMVLLAKDLVENHHSSVFGAAPWLEVQVHGCNLTKKLASEFQEYGNTLLTKQGYGFNVTRPSE
ncbi:hypothetical protein JYB87_07395 [Shewanella avicenniae]|uniref:Uncharacterized protein n=1 Tax=Shewanella avicenniae TaxID=2814294 RepID=A0ABX7QVM4_9GAMM|nr:hypothetical protein [Shewanella avicenniae]QSX35035.1 hypothetical protein JYB87_07395 [Shewanella avicenniae]